jgi:hypothetical protein
MNFTVNSEWKQNKKKMSDLFVEFNKEFRKNTVFKFYSAYVFVCIKTFYIGKLLTSTFANHFWATYTYL